MEFAFTFALDSGRLWGIGNFFVGRASLTLKTEIKERFVIRKEKSWKGRVKQPRLAVSDVAQPPERKQKQINCKNRASANYCREGTNVLSR